MLLSHRVALALAVACAVGCTATSGADQYIKASTDGGSTGTRTGTGTGAGTGTGTGTGGTVGQVVLVAAGEFWMGCAPSDSLCDPDEKPRHQVYLDAFYIDETEVTVAQYRECVNAGSCNTEGMTATLECNWDQSRDNHPINCVTWSHANVYCSWAGARLPTEAEWEKAARGTDERIYPWGNEPPSDQLCWYQHESVPGTCAVGSYSSGASPYGALDMAGNVSEWVNDWWDYYYYEASPSENPTGPADGSSRASRGGGWKYFTAKSLRASERYGYLPQHHVSYFGFRCARSPE